MTAVPGRYDPSSEFYSPETESISRSTAEVETNPDDGFDVYLHGNAALALNKLVTTKKQVKVCISSTKGTGIELLIIAFHQTLPLFSISPHFLKLQ